MAKLFFSNNNHVANVIKEVLPLFIVDSNFKITYVNDLFCQTVQYEKEELLNKHMDTVKINPIDIDNMPLINEESFRQEKYVQKEIEYLDKQGNIYWATTSITYLLDEVGEMSHYI